MKGMHEEQIPGVCLRDEFTGNSVITHTRTGQARSISNGPGLVLFGGRT